METNTLLNFITEEPVLLVLNEVPLLVDSDSSDQEIYTLSVRRPRRFNPRIDHFLYEETDFRARFRLSRVLVQSLINTLESELRIFTNRNFAVTAAQQVLLTLQFYATGTFQRCVGDMSGLSKSTVCRVIHRVSHAIAQMRPNHIFMPTNPRDVEETVQRFYEISSFPKVLAAIDCTHIPIQSPGGNNAEYYRNRKSTFSINVQCMADANLCIRNIVARWPGSAHDQHIFNSSAIKYRLENAEFGDKWILGDRGYGIKPYLLTPLGSPTTHAERLYNESQIRTRNVVERTFGVWKRRFPAIATNLRVKIEKVQAIIIATAVLHNICRKANEELPDIDCAISDENYDEDTEDIESEELGDESEAEQLFPHDENNRLNLINNYFSRM